MQKKKLFRSGFVIAGLVCMSFILSGCAKKAKKKVEEREVRVTVQKIEKRNFRRQIPVQGTVDPVQFAVLSAKLGGTVEHFPVSTGMKLKKGDTIYGIDRQVLKNQVTMRKDEIKVKQAEVQNAEASKASALLSRKKAELDYKRAKKLHDSKAISDAEFEEYDTNYQKAQTKRACADKLLI
jgi:HlyD family secretion protein